MGANQRSNIFLTISNPLPPPLPQEFTNLYCTSKGTCRVWSLGGGTSRNADKQGQRWKPAPGQKLHFKAPNSCGANRGRHLCSRVPIPPQTMSHRMSCRIISLCLAGGPRIERRFVLAGRCQGLFLQPFCQIPSNPSPPQWILYELLPRSPHQIHLWEFCCHPKKDKCCDIWHFRGQNCLKPVRPNQKKCLLLIKSHYLLGLWVSWYIFDTGIHFSLLWWHDDTAICDEISNIQLASQWGGWTCFFCVLNFFGKIFFLYVAGFGVCFLREPFLTKIMLQFAFLQ